MTIKGSDTARHGGRREHAGSQQHQYTGLRWREVRGPAEALAAAICLQAREDWRRVSENGRGKWPKEANRDELADFLTGDWCHYLCDVSGLDYWELLRQTVGEGY